eukprot:SAG11_NODE_560_length_8528_cov_4.697710_5_plen_63_part_00
MYVAIDRTLIYNFTTYRGSAGVHQLLIVPHGTILNLRNLDTYVAVLTCNGLIPVQYFSSRDQ